MRFGIQPPLKRNERAFLILLIASVTTYALTGWILKDRDPLVQMFAGSFVDALVLVVLFGTRVFLLFVAPGLVLYFTLSRVLPREEHSQ